jgi:hypothetical protein
MLTCKQFPIVLTTIKLMIIVKLNGGLGNQLFQYAFARSVSSRLKTDFRLDTNPFNTYYKFHKYSLNHFNIKKQFAKDFDFFGFVWLVKQHRIFDTFYKYLRMRSKLMPFYYPQQTFHFDSSVFSKNGTYFDGGWVTEKYFKEIETELREELTLNKPLSDYSQGMLEKIKKTQAVSLHVRRADYVTGSTFKDTPFIHGTCSMEYYKNAINYITEREQNPHFFIFSDDYEWSVENFKFLNYPVICVKNGAEKNYEDLILMSRCKHNIIANSTFSWWGAWLNNNKDKIVIAPQKWFNTQKSNTKDVIPDTWVKF